MARNGTLRVRIIGDAAPFQKSLSGLSGKIAAFGKAAAAAGALAAGAMVKFGSDAVSAASDLEQSIGAVESVFGDAAGRIFEFGDTAAQQLGLSRREINETASVLGASLQSMGFSSDETADQVINLQERAADMAATFGGSTREALDAVASLMRGERDPIERYGVAIKQSDVNARLAADGLDNLEGAAAKQAEAQAALSLLFEQTAKVEGQFARESDTLAGKQARLGAQFENMKAQIGEQLMPVALRLADWASATLPNAFARTREAISRAGQFIDEWWPRVQSAFVTIRDIVTAAISRVRSVIDGVRTTLDENRSTIATWRDTAVQIFGQIRDVVASAIGAVTTIIRTAVNVITEFWNRFGKHLWEFAVQTFKRIVDTVRGAFQILKGVFDLIKAVLTGQWGDAWEAIKSILAGAWRIIRNVIGQAWETVKTLFGAGVAAISQVWSFLWDQAKKVLRSAWDAIVQTVRDKLADAKGTFDGIVDFVAGLPSRITSAASGMWDGITAAFRAAVNTIIRGWNDLRFQIGGRTFDLPGPLGAITVPSMTLDTPNIPFLAQGGVFNANSPTLAVVGDNRTQREIVSPEGTMKDAMRDVLREGGSREVHQHFYGLVTETVTGRAAALALRMA